MKPLFIITKGLENSGSAIRAIQIAAMTAEQGSHVEVFLLDEAVHWAQGLKTGSGQGLSNYMDMLNSRAHPVLVCKSCAERRLIRQDDLIEGAVIATMPLLAEKIASPDYKVLTF
jgi:sulfur relay (sulfurtransferase) complex TusBCD TusD component (DsrE family)